MDRGVPYVSANCIDDDRVDMEAVKFLTDERAATIRKGVARNGDVLFAHNATVGPVSVLHTEEPKVILSTSLTYYRWNPSHIIPEYLAHYMRSPLFRRQHETVMRQSTRNQVPITKQREFLHVIPPLAIQRSVADQLDTLDETRREWAVVYTKKLSSIADLKQSILRKAFTGELT